jgi:hypothetical protein
LGQVAKSKPRYTSGVLTTAALGVATEWFANIARKGSDTPYLSHLLAVSALVMEHGGSEEQAAAALLHDVIEDVGVSADELVDLLVARGVDRIAAEHVASMVQATTDGRPGDKRDPADWRRRKHAYLEGLTEKPMNEPALLVSLADKVHNAEATLVLVRGGISANDLYGKPEFNAKAPDQKWYYTALAAVFREKLGETKTALPLIERLERAVGTIFADVPDSPLADGR